MPSFSDIASFSGYANFRGARFGVAADFREASFSGRPTSMERASAASAAAR
jgi:hypothetical protein